MTANRSFVIAGNQNTAVILVCPDALFSKRKLTGTELYASDPEPTPPKWDWSAFVGSFPPTLGLMVLQPNNGGEDGVGE